MDWNSEVMVEVFQPRMGKDDLSVERGSKEHWREAKAP
jgi:hypothetical protein